LEFFRNFPQKIPKNFSGILLRKISEKFLGLGLLVCGFLGELNERISFKKFMGISSEFHPRKFLRIFPEYFSGNS